MKTLYLLRHAKPDPAGSGIRDRDRPLTDRGRRVAERIGLKLRQTGAPPTLVLCSPARRAAETLAHLLPGLGFVPLVETREDLYLCGWPTVLEAIWKLPDKVDRVLLVAHNPDLHDLAHHLTVSGAPGALRAVELAFPVGALATLVFSVTEWSAVTVGSATLAGFVRPDDAT